MPFTSGLGTASSGLSNIELGIGESLSPSVNAALFMAIVQNRFATAKVVQRSTNQLITVPSSFDMAITEIFPYTVDVTNYLGTNDSVGSVAPTLTLLSTSQVVQAPWYSAPIIQGNIVTIPINVGYLSFGQQYQIAVNFIASSSKHATYTSIFNVT